jgi:hypothetical protein
VTHPEKNKLRRVPTTEEQAFEAQKTNKPGATWKVFAVVRLLTDKFSGERSESAATPG